MTRDVSEELALASPEDVTSLLVSIIEATASGPAVEPLAGSVARLIIQATATDVCFVHVLDDEGTALALAGATAPFDDQVGGVRLPLGTGVTGWVAENRQPAVIVEDKFRDPRYVAIPALRGAEYTSMASVPMATDVAGLVGVLNVHTRARREFTTTDVALLTTIGNLVAGALHQARLHRRLVTRERTLERFAEQIVSAQETERRRLAGDIHDGIVQQLVSITYHLDAAQRCSGEQVGEQVRCARTLAEHGLEEARATLAGLRPPVLDDLGLGGGLTSLAASVHDLDVCVEASDARLPEHVEIAIYRIAQEALNNVCQHGAASRATIAFTANASAAMLVVGDDGRGFEPEHARSTATGYGLIGMSERAELVGGTLTVRSAPGAGTTVRAEVPLGPGLAPVSPGTPATHRARDGGFLP